MSKLSLLINDIKDKYIQENFKRLVEIINSGKIVGLQGPPGEKGDPGDISGVAYDGAGKYSARFSETVTASTVKDALDEIFVFSSVGPTTVLSLTPSAVREKGNTLSSIVLSTVNTQGSNPTSALVSLVFKRNSVTIDTVTSPSGTSSYTDSTPVTDTLSWSATLTDADARVSTSTATLTFLYPIIHLVGVQGLTPSQIYSGATKILSASASRTLSFTTSNQVPYYCYPSSIAALTSIKDQNNFETIADWNISIISLVGLDGSSQSYRKYEFKNLTSTTQTYTFA